ncbi:hypothetical protein [Thermocrinis jamiesonii]|uniref:hypothetical protein n=1 Tax=Thermocrinis jamiesonii TaxID=1302351 RepID=UPI000496A472|nr:hypothetical protein [Thermocrinis jamiesonii]
MKTPFREFFRYAEWKERFLKEYEAIRSKDYSIYESEIKKLYPEAEERSLRALVCMYVGGYEKRLEDEDVRFWANWAFVKTYKTFGGLRQLSEKELCFLFYSMGKLFVPLLLHEKGVKSESFKALSREEQERAVSDVLETVWENHFIRILQILPSLFE